MCCVDCNSACASTSLFGKTVVAHKLWMMIIHKDYMQQIKNEIIIIYYKLDCDYLATLGACCGACCSTTTPVFCHGTPVGRAI
jgi:hypothetical protein